MTDRWLILFDVDGTLIERNDPDHLAALDHGYRVAFPGSPEISVRQIDVDGYGLSAFYDVVINPNSPR